MTGTAVQRAAAADPADVETGIEGTPDGSDPGTAAAPGPIARVLAGCVRLYQLVVSPWLGPSCRFEPSCSAYALEALRTHGAARGLWLTVRRLGRCQPFCTGGYDPVPEPRKRRGRSATGGAALPGSTPPEGTPRADGQPDSTDNVSPSRFSQGRAPSTESPVASGSPDRGVPAC